MFLGSRSYTDYIYVGTIKHKESLLSWVLYENPTWKSKIYKAVISFAERDDLWADWEGIITDLSLEKGERVNKAREFYKAHEEEMLKGTKVLWPAKWPYYDLMVKRISEGSAAYHRRSQKGARQSV
jgi:hypothetical protein